MGPVHGGSDYESCLLTSALAHLKALGSEGLWGIREGVCRWVGVGSEQVTFERAECRPLRTQLRSSGPQRCQGLGP